MEMKTTLFELSYSEILKNPPECIILPWGATEAHGQHLPYASDVTEAFEISKAACHNANKNGAKAIVLPPIPFGNDAQQLSSFATIHINSSTAFAILDDVCFSLSKQGIKKLLIANSHGGNNFKPFIRDLQLKYAMLLLLVDLHLMIPEKVKEIFVDYGDHAGEIETSLMLYLAEEFIDKNNFRNGNRIPFTKSSFNQAGVWTPRPWKESHPDLGSGNPKKATKEKGKIYLEFLVEEFSKVIKDFSDIKKGEMPFV